MTRNPFFGVRPRALAAIAVAGLLPLLGGCSSAVLNPSGDVAAQQRDLIVIATVLMLLIIIPVMVLTVVFARKYRADNKATEAEYDPDWDHSTALELVIWAAPLLIIICLGAVTWTSTHRLDPYRPIERIHGTKAIDPNVKPLDVQVVSLNWKWLFIYPEYGIATVNDVAAPVDRPIRFHLTSDTVMNAFYVPALAGMIYTMPSMETKLNAVINKPGNYEGFSSNFSGAGFSHMRFRFHGLTDAQFQQWVGQAKASGQALDTATYLTLAQPSQNVPVARYSGVAPNLYDKIMNHCVAPGSMCMRDMMQRDAATALGKSIAGGEAPMGDMHGMGGMDNGATAPADGQPTADADHLHGAGMTPPGRRAPRAMTADAHTPVRDPATL